MKKLVYVLIAVSLVLVLLPAAATALFADETMEGCTPGYWKQVHHWGSWVNPPYDPETSRFDVMFGVDCKDMACEGKTLLEVLKTGGGGEKALGRHAVAALLNASHPDVDYLYSPGDVIGKVQAAYTSGDFETYKDLLEVQNELDCPLGREAAPVIE
jgi:hypothetical protein